jgi:23S rRNA-/tRNA-specific pseudouridylate synthase
MVKNTTVKIDLKTGRTHQTRVHFSYLRPCGDKPMEEKNCGRLDRPFCIHVSCHLPTKNGEKVTYKSELPNDLVNTLELMGYEKDILV